MIPSIPFFLKNRRQFMKHLKQDKSSHELSFLHFIVIALLFSTIVLLLDIASLLLDPLSCM